MSFSINKFANEINPEFDGLDQIKTDMIIGIPHKLDYVEFGTKKDGTKYARVRAMFDDGRKAWYYTASYGLVGTLQRVEKALGIIPSDARVCIVEIDVGGKNPMLTYTDADNPDE